MYEVSQVYDWSKLFSLLITDIAEIHYVCVDKHISCIFMVLTKCSNYQVMNMYLD